MMIWIVEGSTGEYSDHSEWPVKAYKTEAQAKEMVELCSAEYRRIMIIINEKELSEWDLPDLPELKHKYDKSCSFDYSGTHYRCYPVELED